MIKARDVARYFLGKDADHILFNKNLVEKNGRKFYEGNARLNKYLHMAQNLYIAKTGEKLFDDDLYAYDNGAVVVDVQENFSVLQGRGVVPKFADNICDFLDRVYIIFENATLDEMIELSHEDSEWEAKHNFFSKKDQKMDSLAHVKEYKKQYHDVLNVMERIKGQGRNPKIKPIKNRSCT